MHQEAISSSGLRAIFHAPFPVVSKDKRSDSVSALSAGGPSATRGSLTTKSPTAQPAWGPVILVLPFSAQTYSPTILGREVYSF